MSILLLLSTALITALCYIYVKFRLKYRFWHRLNVPYLAPTFPIGNIHEWAKPQHFAFVSQCLHNSLQHFGDYAGTYFISSPMLVVLTPEFAKTVFIRDFQHFTDRGLYSNKKSDPLSGNLFFVDGLEWRMLRQKISPTFTSGKIKMMFHTVLAISDELVKQLRTDSQLNESIIGIRDLLARFTTDVLGSCGFGIDCNSIENPKSEFREMGKKMFNYSKLKNLKSMLCMLYKKEATRLNVRFSEEDLTEFVIQLVKTTIKYRREHNVRRNDFMQLMIDLYKEEDTQLSEDGLSVEDIAAQAFLFFFAGFETSSTTMAFCLYEISLRPDIQDRLRQEICESYEKNGNTFTYDSILSLNYLDQVISETLRKHPPVASLHRAVSKDYTLPNGSVIPTGTFVLLSTYAFHHSPNLYPEPDRFDPERFTIEMKEKRHPCAFLPFGEGPRNCVGLRFGLLQTKIGLATLLRNFKFSSCHKTQIPLQIDPISLVYVPKDEVWLKVEGITDNSI